MKKRNILMILLIAATVAVFMGYQALSALKADSQAPEIRLDAGIPEISVEDLQAPQPLEALVREELVTTMDSLLSMLEPRQREILRLHFGMDGGKTLSLEEIGLHLGISKERVRQIEKQAMQRLKELGADMGLEDFLE